MKTTYRKQVSALMKANPIKPAGKARRKKDTIPGYYPNPINQGAADQLLKIAQEFIDKAEGYTSREAVMHATGVAYGIIMSLERYGEITSAQARDTFSAIRKLTK